MVYLYFVGTFLVKQGFQNLWETIAKKENLNIKFGSEISAVHRYFDEDGNTNNDKVKICDRGGCYEHDFVIWSPELKSSLYHFKPYYKKEEEYFSKMKSVFLVATLVSMSGGRLMLAVLSFSQSQKEAYTLLINCESVRDVYVFWLPAEPPVHSALQYCAVDVGYD